MLSIFNLRYIIPKLNFNSLMLTGQAFTRFSSSDSHIIQMRGLDQDTTEQDIVEFFRPLGITPKKINLNRDGSGRTAAFSEVEFNTHADAVVALRKKNAFIGNRFIRLTLQSSDTIKESTKEYEKQVELSSQKSHRESQALQQTANIVRMKNAPWRITDEDIFYFFSPVGAKPISVKPVYNENGARIGEFDVHFLSSKDVQKAAAKNNAYFRNKNIHLSVEQR